MRIDKRSAIVGLIELLVVAALIASESGAQPLLNVQSGVQVIWPTNPSKTYLPQWSSNSSGPWAPLGAPVVGDGSAHSHFDPVASGVRAYQVLEMVPPSVATPENGGFESGSGTIASNWSVTTAAGGPVHGVRTNSNPRGGAFNFEVHLASTGAGPVVEFRQSGVPVTGGAAYPFTFYAKALTGSMGHNAQHRILWNAGGDTGYQGFAPGNNAYALISNSVTAPPAATSATVIFRVAGAAIPSQSATIVFDDVALGSGDSGPGNPGQTNILSVDSHPVAKISWLTTAGVEYQPASTTNLASSIWNNFAPLILGDGGTKSILVPMTRPAEFIRVETPSTIVLPPTGLHAIASGSTNAIGLAWTASATIGVIGYRILYGVNSGHLTNSVTLGNVTSAIISGLTPGQTYYLAVAAFTANGQSLPANATLSAQPDTEAGFVALFNAATPLEPPTTVDTPAALITYVADRARDRHAREAMFSAYDHYLSWYWEERTIAIEIIDRVAKGGTDLTFHYTTLTPLSAPEFRAFFRGIGTVAEYHFNVLAPLVGSNQYSATLRTKLPENRPLRLGDRVEIEVSQFIQTPLHGRNNYYGTAILYIVGEGIMPWEAKGPLLDSYPLPQAAWLGGQTTLPYQYSNEPEHRFKQLAGNIAPTNAQPFMLGRRLHHTDFGDGSHSEPGNPVFTEHVGKLGPRFIARSCVACHVNNGRALPPTIGAPMLQTVVKVGSDASGAPHPTLGSVLQPQSTGEPIEGSATIASYATNHAQYGDGTPYSLHKPGYAFAGASPAFFSLRLAPPLVGLGLLEAISETTIAALADPDDANADGISGRLQIVLDPESGRQRLGRFTSKAGKARLSHQIASALNTDMGVTTTVFPILDGETSPFGRTSYTSPTPELTAADLDQMTRYVALLGVGARRDLTDAQALQGEQLFATAHCAKCHTPTLSTSPYHPITELRNQTIHPYTDLLLHDMGPGLADNMGEGVATGSEWRTPPLWNIGFTAGVSGGEAYLHDGRARTLEEAILWHGGEAEVSKEAFRTMSATNRAALIKFLKSL